MKKVSKDKVAWCYDRNTENTGKKFCNGSSF